jgi:hypothetical protein
MIDATRSPRPAWRRSVNFLLVGAMIAAVGNFIWSKELHHHHPKPAHTARAAAAGGPSIALSSPS